MPAESATRAPQSPIRHQDTKLVELKAMKERAERKYASLAQEFKLAREANDEAWLAQLEDDVLDALCQVRDLDMLERLKRIGSAPANRYPTEKDMLRARAEGISLAIGTDPLTDEPIVSAERVYERLVWIIEGGNAKPFVGVDVMWSLYRREMVWNQPLADHLEMLLDEGKTTLSAVAQRVGWTHTHQGRVIGDTTRLKRRLGMEPASGKGEHKDVVSTLVSYEQAVDLCRAMDVDPISLGL